MDEVSVESVEPSTGLPSREERYEGGEESAGLFASSVELRADRR